MRLVSSSIGTREIDHGAQLLQVGHGPLPADGAAPWGDDGAAAVHGADGLLLHLEEVLHPELVQDVLEQQALPLLDHQVGVQKAVAQGFGQKNAHSALARAGHADENDVVQSVILPLYRLISELV